jgi:hypothetical protein
MIKHLYNSLCLSVSWSVGPSIRLWVPTMKFLNLLLSKSGYVKIASASPLVWIILV